MTATGQPEGTVQEFEFCDQLPVLHEKLQAPTYPAAQEPAEPPLGVPGKSHPFMTVAGQFPGISVQEFEVCDQLPLLQK